MLRAVAISPGCFPCVPRSTTQHSWALCVRRSVAAVIGRRLFGGSANDDRSLAHQSEAKYDAELAELYNSLASQHGHPNGPWRLMTNAVQRTIAERDDDGDLFPRILDIAPGAGEPAATVARSIPEAGVYSTDLSEDMVQVAEEVAMTLPNMTVHIADMQKLTESFKPGYFHLATCCYGFMYPDNLPLALTQTHEVLKPGGTLVAATWDSYIPLFLLRDIMRDVLGTEPSPPPVNPHALAKVGCFEMLLESAQFVDLEMVQSTYPFDFGNDEEGQLRLTTMLVSEQLDELDAWDAARESFRTHADKYSRIDGSGCRIFDENTFKMTVAKKAV